jgi:hypothetical protein
MKRFLLLLTFVGICVWQGFAQQAGDTLKVNGKLYKLLSANIITNPGFESDFTGWTDGTTSAATLTSAKFTIVATGGVNNSKYLVGTANEAVNGSGSIGTGWPIGAGKTYLFYYSVKYLTATTAAGSEAWLKISLTNNKTTGTEPLIILGTGSVGDAGQWTQNAILFTNSSSYGYLQARFRWLNNRLGFDNFALHEAYEIPDLATLQSTINSAVAMYDSTAKGAAVLQSAITSAKGYLTSTLPAEVRQSISDLQKAITTYQYSNASPDKPLSMNSFLVNPGFDANSTGGWTGPGTVNYHEVEFYQKTFDMFQTISGLPAGKYRLRVKGFERPKSNDAGAAYKAGTEKIYSRFYAKATDFTEVNTPLNSIYKHGFTGTGAVSGYVNTMAGAETMMTNTITNYYDTTLPEILLNAGGTLILGAKCDTFQTGTWILFDNFRLDYLGAYDVADLVTAVNSRITEATDMLSSTMQHSAVDLLAAAISRARDAVAANPQVYEILLAAKDNLTTAMANATISINAYLTLQKTIDHAYEILGFLDKQTEIDKLQAAINTAKVSVLNTELTLTEITTATTTLKTTTRSVGKQIYVPSSMGDVNVSTNNWSRDRSKESKNWILFWEPGWGSEPVAAVDQCLALAEKCFNYYADSLKFIKRGSSKTDQYKMIIKFRYTASDVWEATGSGVDNTIGLLTLTSWALSSRGGQTIAHEVGHCFQYQVHCDNNDQNGWMYGYAADASGSNGFWEQCAQWQAYKVMPTQQFTSEWFSGYMTTVHKHPIHETPRYNNYFIQDFWSDLHGREIIGRLWNESKKPEDPIEAYQRINGITQSQFNDEMYLCGARFASWDIPALRTLGASTITARPQPKMNNMGSNWWMVDSTVCLENYGHNVLKLNASVVAKTVEVNFEGKAGTAGFRNAFAAYAGWRFGFVVQKIDGTRVYSEIKSVNMAENGGKATLRFDCPDNTNRLWLVVSGAPSTHWRHAWDDNDANDEQWPYQVKFGNTNLSGYANVPMALSAVNPDQIKCYTENQTLIVGQLPENARIQLFSLTGKCLFQESVSGTDYSKTLPMGVYILKVNSSTGTFERKVLIQ